MLRRRKGADSTAKVDVVSRPEDAGLDHSALSRATLLPALFEQVATGLVVLDPQTLHIQDVNAHFSMIMDLPAEQLLGRSLEELLHPADAAADRALWDHFRTTGDLPPPHREKRYQRPDGEAVWVQETFTLLRDARQTPLALVGVVDALSARQRQERELAVLLSATVEAMTEGLVLYDPTGKVRHLNTAARQLWGVEAQPAYFARPLAERRARLVVQDLHGQPVPVEQWPISRILCGETISAHQAVELQVQTLDGREIIANYSGGPLRDPAGELVGAMTLTRDVTDQRRLDRRTQEALTALLELVETLVALQSAGHLRSSLHQVVESTRCIFGCEVVTLAAIEPETERWVPLALTGRAPAASAAWWASLGQSGPAERFTADQLQRLQAGEAVILELEPLAQRGVPTYGTQAALTVPLLDQGQLVGAVTLAYERERHAFSPEEVTLATGMSRLASLFFQRERLLRERTGAQIQAQALDHANQEMSASLSLVGHELRTPITSIRGQAQLLKRRLQRLPLLPAPGEQSSEEETSVRLTLEEGLERIEAQTWRMNRLVEDMLEAARIQTGQLTLRRERWNLAALVEEVVAEQQFAWPQRQLVLHATTMDAVWVEADAERTRQVLTNYLTNAFKYAPPTHPIEIFLRQTEQQARVDVRDQGPGIPLEEQPRIWERFHQVPGAAIHSGSGGGLGLGLYLCKALIEGQGGQVGVESRPGQGSTFWFRLPVLPAHEHPPLAHERPPWRS